MTSHRTTRLAVCVSIASLLLLSSQAAGFNPQPDPPGKWYVEGYIDLWTQAVDPTGAAMPFGIDRDIVGDAVSDFSGGVIARFSAPATADNKPVDGTYDVDFEYFRLQIGDTTWDETMLPTLQFQVFGGIVNAMGGPPVTVTMPGHPDLSLALSAPPGTWEALDERDLVNLGVVTGTYALRDGVVPEPATLALLAVGLGALVARRRRTA